MSHGNIRIMLETIKRISKASGLTLEQVADCFDAHVSVAEEDDQKKPVPLAAMPMGKVQ